MLKSSALNLETTLNMIRTFLLTVIAACICAVSGAVYAQSRISGGTVTTDAGSLNVPVYRISVASGSPEVAALAKRVLDTHGSYIINSVSPQLTFNFTKAANNAVRVTVTGARSFDRSFTGSDWQEALYIACDAATEAVLGSPGFFAGKFAFTYSRSGGNSEIYMADIGFQKVRALTTDKSDSMMPHFSPDGTKLTYTGYFRSGFMDLFEINIVSKTRRSLASYKGSNTGGAYSPDGSKIAFILSTTGNAEIWIGNSAGKSLKRLTATTSTESSASFSPDGSKIIFASDPRGAPLLYTMPVTGGKATAVPTSISRYCTEPAWNYVFPSKIAFTAAVGGGFQVAVFDYGIRSSKWVSKGPGNTSWPTWLNDGRHLVCTKTSGASKSLWIIDTETGKQTRLHSSEFGNASEAAFNYPSR